ncbi:MAG: sulfite exporter TauE/SafE family protein [Oscillospiraceae bacterium]|nr:sulfite exporter TauE/SafE family protein [Oscillospiraceae bacterium]
MKYWKFILSGVLTGFVNGLFGAGGGMLMVPLLTRFCGVEDKEAFATSLCIVLPISLVSLVVYALKGTLELQGALPYLLGGSLGGVVAGLSYKKVSATLLHKVLAVVILLGGIRLVLA